MNATQRSPRSVLLALSFLVVLIAIAGPVHPAGEQDPDKAPRAAPENKGLDLARSAVQTAFARADADGLRPVLSQRVKIYLSSALFGVPEGYYGAGQTLLLFRRLFEKRTTLRFVFLQRSSKASEEGQVTLAALWVYREERTEGVEARLSFTFSPEGPSWRIREIRDLK